LKAPHSALPPPRGHPPVAIPPITGKITGGLIAFIEGIAMRPIPQGAILAQEGTIISAKKRFSTAEHEFFFLVNPLYCALYQSPVFRNVGNASSSLAFFSTASGFAGLDSIIVYS